MNVTSFIDLLFETLEELINPTPGNDPIVVLEQFLKKLPGVYLTERHVLPFGNSVQGKVILCEEKKYLELASEEKEKKEIRFDYFDDGTAQFQFYGHTTTGSWDEITDRLTSRISPGDRLMSLGKRQVNFFSYA